MLGCLFDFQGWFSAHSSHKKFRFESERRPDKHEDVPGDVRCAAGDQAGAREDTTGLLEEKT